MLPKAVASPHKSRAREEKRDMPDIKENIKQELLKMIEEEKKLIYYRRVNTSYSEENYQIQAEENFIEELERFVKSI